MEDVFGGLAGGPGDGSPPVDVASLEAILDDAAVLGVELEPRFRVLAVTFEPTPERVPWPETRDRRIQVLCFPVSTILASFRREGDGEGELLSFTESQLVDVAGAVAGARAQGPLFGRPEPRPGSWGPRFSMEGRSTAPDGTRRTITLALRDGELALDLFARFDDLEVRGPTGETIDPGAHP